MITRTSPYPDAWLRIVRAGSVFYTYYSTNNLDWLSLDGGGITPPEPFADSLLVGVASSQVSVSGPGGSYAQFVYSGFQNFVPTSGTIVITTQPTNTTVLENRPVTFSVAATLQGGDSSGLRYQWRTNDVDVPGANGPSFSIALPTRALSGTEVRCLASAGPVVAPVASATAILTVTPDNAPPAARGAYAFALLPAVTVVFDELLDPVMANDPGRYTLDGGNVVTAATLQPDGLTVLLNVTGVNAPQFQLGYAGITDLAGNAANASITGSTIFDNLSVVDIQGGFPTTSSLLSFTSTGFTLQSSLGDIWGGADSCNFIYQAITNDFDVRLHIPQMTVAAGYGRGGLMARLTTDPDSPNLMVGTYRSGFNSYIWTERAAPGATTTFATAAQDPTFPNVWVRLQRIGSTFNAYHAPDGFRWTQFGTITDLPDTNVWLVGMAFSTCVLNDPAVGTVQWEQFGATVLLPQLQIARAGDTVVLSWPAAATGFQLQQAESLPAGSGWTGVTESPALVGENYQVTLPASSTARYYRLAQ